MITDVKDITSFKWATVQGTNPLSVTLDGDTAALAMVPDSLVDPLSLYVGERVRVELSLRKAVIHGAANRGQAATVQALLDPAYRGPGPASVSLLTGGGQIGPFQWDIPYVPNGSRVVDLRPSAGTWRIVGQDDGGTMPIAYGAGWGSYNDSTGARQWAIGRSQRLSSGIVILSGLLRKASAIADGELLGTLAVGHRPDREMVFGINNSDVARYISINAAGEIRTGQSFGAGTYVSLDGNVSFPAAGVATWTPIDPQGTAGSDHTFLNSWVDYIAGGGTYGRASYWKDPYGFVWFTGMVKGGATADNTTMFGLPTTHRAARVHHMATASNASFGIVGSSPTSTGLDVKAGNTGNTWVSLSGVTLLTAEAIANNPWKAVTLVNGWVSYPISPTTYLTPSALRRGDGLAVTHGMLGGGTIGNKAFFLHEECTPPRTMLTQNPSSAARGRIDIVGYNEQTNSNGSQAYTPNQGTNSWVSMDGVKFMVNP